MKRLFLTGMLMFFSFQAFSAPISTVSKLQFGDNWPFTREEVMLNCRSDGAWFVINPATLVQYPLNDIAMEQMKSGKVNAQLIDIIVLPDPNNAEEKKSLDPIKREFSSLCTKN
ncbi:YebY family protein [Proteus myxofaciens]|uniref:Putative periplasmic/exported protein n=1 Tax=Proteus myxofaciens ATCC 19692 TaxID=1354337 RepID=A0A198F9Y0_9GAMM|nr:YebY family protein [Proteus myxofaciens]OAT21595.1 putative periplasmic/exported protein [Proteus myxofaciens ATCC 19692]